MKIVIAGATGFVGSHLAVRLVDAGHSVVLISRGKTSSPGRLQGLQNADHHHLEITETPKLVKAISGCDAVVNCVGIHREKSSQTFDRLHIQAVRSLISALRQSQITRFIHVSFLQARSYIESPYHHTKWQGEEVIRATDLRWTIVKPGIIYGPGDGFVTNLKRTLTHTPFFVLSTGEDVTIAPLHIDDLTRVLEQCLIREDTVRKTFALVGAENYTLRQLVKQTAESIRVIPSFVRVPLALQRIAAMVMEKTMKEPLVSNAQITILGEHLIDSVTDCDALPDDLQPTLGYHLPD